MNSSYFVSQKVPLLFAALQVHRDYLNLAVFLCHLFFHLAELLVGHLELLLNGLHLGVFVFQLIEFADGLKIDSSK